MLGRFLRDESGATAIEYGLIAALMFLACMTAFYAFGDSATAMFNRIGTAITQVTNRP
ncbi:Flp family type IVb pilin [Asticcacaulis sp. 201]|uniref:Flp family type IVb pilin n=1 Tax=Asticcacaulis sp. 201 TaxID=3028787 RepID=UPI0029170811|nr:Flp family type IVb pilin [Asticcacaulis sp. 201]MDV6332072.1 Flp family type IVb pilin [Asticcacaulis sp. 201]